MPLLLCVCWAFLLAPHSFAREILFPNSPLQEARVEWNARTTAPGEIEIDFRVGGIELTEQRDGYQVSSKGLSPLGRIGAPDVGVTGILLAAPPGMEPKIEVLDLEESWLESTPVAPCQAKTRCDPPESKTALIKKANIYRSERLFPKQAAVLQELGSVQSVRFYRIALQPIQFLPRSSTLKVTTAMKIMVRFDGTSEPFEIGPSVRSLLSNALNGSEMHRLAKPLLSPETLIVVSADSLKTAVEPYVQWKQQKGLRVEHYSASEAGRTKEGIQAFIQSRYQQLARKPSFLLLVGNKATLPGFRERTGQGFAASDYPYTLLEGDDFLPDILQGRLLADSQEEAETQVARWIAYEKNPVGSWYSNATTIASSEGRNPSDEGYAAQVADALLRYTYRSVDRLFQRSSTATALNVVSALESGRSWVAYFGHGSGYDWSSMNDDFNVVQIAQLKNTHRLPFVVDIACQNGSWMDVDRSFGKTWVSASSSGSPAGAIAYLGGSVNISWHEPATMSVGIAKYHFERRAQSLGASVLAGQLYLTEQMGIAPNTIDNFKWFNLFGDPSLTLRTSAPLPYQLKHTAIKTGDAWVIPITATDTGNNPLEGVNVAVWAPGSIEPLAYGSTSPQGELTLWIPDSKNLPSGGLLTASGYNLETYQISLVSK
jgi:hypothetical protein